MEVKRERVRKRKGQKKVEANILRKVKRCGTLRKCPPAVGKLENIALKRKITISSNFLSFSFFYFFNSFVVCCFVNQLGPSHGLLSPGGQENVEGGGGEGKGGEWLNYFLFLKFDIDIYLNLDIETLFHHIFFNFIFVQFYFYSILFLFNFIFIQFYFSSILFFFNFIFLQFYFISFKLIS